MPANTKNIPKLRRQREKGRPDRAFVVLDGRRVPCGRWGTEASRQRYDRAIAEWLANGRQRPLPKNELVTIAVLVDRYWSHAENYYMHRDGSPTWEQAGIRQALRPLTRLYADLRAHDFGPGELRAVQRAMVELGWSRPYVNKSVSRIRRMLTWAV
ncbi:MAG: hypothetical protein ACODAQ_11880, partial [Phycisphaeraceae bacterium]